MGQVAERMLERQRAAMPPSPPAAAPVRPSINVHRPQFQGGVGPSANSFESSTFIHRNPPRAKLLHRTSFFGGPISEGSGSDHESDIHGARQKNASQFNLSGAPQDSGGAGVGELVWGNELDDEELDYAYIEQQHREERRRKAVARLEEVMAETMAARGGGALDISRRRRLLLLPPPPLHT